MDYNATIYYYHIILSCVGTNIDTTLNIYNKVYIDYITICLKLNEYRVTTFSSLWTTALY